MQGMLTNGWMVNGQGNTAEPEGVSTSDPSEFPSLLEANQMLEEQKTKQKDVGAAILDGNTDDDGHEGVASKRPRKRLLSAVGDPNTTATAESRENHVPTQTVVLKPICRENVKDFKTRDIKSAVEKAGITSPDDYKIQIQPKTNTIALTTRNAEITGKLLQVTEITRGETSYALRPYKAVGSNHVRGVIYLHGDNTDETPETLLADLECRTAKVVNARRMGKNSNAVVITFEGTQLPKKVMFCREVFDVKMYRPRPIVCYSCHSIGHMTDVCPSKERRCDRCGYIHEEMEECTRDPQCRNCDGPHVATSNDCPKRKIPDKKQPAKQQLLKQPKANYAAAAKAAAASKDLPPVPKNLQQQVIQDPVSLEKWNASSNEKTATPGWIPQWAQRTKAATKEQPDWRNEIQALEAKFEKQDAKIAKLEKDMAMGFNMVFQVLGEIKREISELKHG